MPDEPTILPGILSTAQRIAVSRYVALETQRRAQMLVLEQDPEAAPPLDLPCLDFTPQDAEALEDAIYTLVSQLADEIVRLMELNPGAEFATLIWMLPDGSLTAQPYEVGPGGVGYLDVNGVNFATVLAMIHGHPRVAVTSEGTYTLYDPSRPGYALMPSADRPLTVGGVTQLYGDWLSFDDVHSRIEDAGGNTSLFRQYIVGFGAYSAQQRPGWHLVEPNAQDRKDSNDYLNDQDANEPGQSLPININPINCSDVT